MPREDYRNVRDAARALRKAHLQQRRTSGTPLAGGRSEAQSVISTPTGLAETETIQLSAVNGFSYLREDDPILDLITLPNVYDTDHELLRLNIVGTGSAWLITFQDDCQWVTSDIVDGVSVSYKMEVLDPDGNVFEDPTFKGPNDFFGEFASITVTAVSIALTSISGASVPFPHTLAPPFIRMLVNLRDDVTYSLVITARKSRQNAVSDSITVFSTDRRLTVQEVKR